MSYQECGGCVLGAFALRTTQLSAAVAEPVRMPSQTLTTPALGEWSEGYHVT